MVELVVTVAILVVIVGVVIVRFSSFDSLILLKTLSYDVALSVREAQSYSIGVVGKEGNFDTSYGLSFTEGANQYTLFKYDGAGVPYFDSGSPDNIVDVYKLGSSYVISDLCIKAVDSSGASPLICDGIDRIDVSFIRPEFDAHYYVTGSGVSGSGEDADAAVIYAIIKIQSGDKDATSSVQVLRSGQITVELE